MLEPVYCSSDPVYTGLHQESAEQSGCIDWGIDMLELDYTGLNQGGRRVDEQDLSSLVLCLILCDFVLHHLTISEYLHVITIC